MSIQISRRNVLKGAAATAGAAALGPVLASPAAAQTSPAPGQLVVVFLRGGQDALSTVVPFTDSNYYDARPTVAIPDDQVIQLDDRFGFHPALQGTSELFDAGRLSVVVGAGNFAANRSHFVAQDLWEYGDTSVPDDGHGWLGRYLQQSAVDGDSLFRGVASGNNVSLSLRGYPALGIGAISTFGLGGRSGLTADYEEMLREIYSGDSSLSRTGTAALEAAAEVGSLSGSSSQDRTERAFADIATLLDAELGVEVVTYDMGGWDTHDNMGTPSGGEMVDLLGGLDGALSSFQADLDARGLESVTTVVMTEFGRRVAENGSGGTDHGFGSVMLAMGGAVNGGQIFGDIAPLSPELVETVDGDVPGVVDGRDVLGDLATAVLGVGDPSSLFPDHVYDPVGIAG